MNSWKYTGSFGSLMSSWARAASPPSPASADFRAQRGGSGVIARHRRGNERDQRTRGRDLRRLVRNFARVELEHFPHGAAHVASRQRVVADERHATGRQMARDQRQYVGAHVRRYPRVEAVRDDVVEAAHVRGKFAQVELQKADVGEAQVACHARGARHGTRGEIEADERRVRQRGGDRHQVRAIAACEFEDPARRDGRDVEAEQRRYRGQMVGVARGVRIARIGDVVVGLDERFRVLPGFVQRGVGHAYCREARVRQDRELGERYELYPPRAAQPADPRQGLRLVRSAQPSPQQMVDGQLAGAVEEQ